MLDVFVQNLTVKGFRGFRNEGSLQFGVPNGRPGSGLTVLTGPNNGGKTSILELLKMLGAESKPEFSRSQRNPDHDYVEARFVMASGEQFAVSSTARGAYTSTWSTDSGNPPLPGRLYTITANRELSPHFSKNPWGRDTFAVQSSQARASRSERPELNSYLTTIAETPALKAMFDAAVLEVLGFDVPWELDRIESGQYVFSIRAETGHHTSDGLGYGVLSVFSLVAGLMDSAENDVVCVDEPEVSLHPQVQRRVSEYLHAKSAQTQIVISTHSPYLVVPTWLADGAVLARISQRNGSTTISELSNASRARIAAMAKDLNNPHIFGLEAREVFFVDAVRRVLVVEGQEDVVILRRYCAQAGVTLDADFFGWGAGGAEKIGYVLQVLTDLGIDDVAVLLDGDKAHLVDSLFADFPHVRFVVLSTDDIRDKPARTIVGKDGMFTSEGTLKAEHQAAMNQVLAQLGAAR